MAQVGAPPPPLGPQTGMGPPARPHHVDPNRHRQHQQQHQHHKPRPPGSHAAAGNKQQKPVATAGRLGGQAAAVVHSGAPVPAIAADGTAELERLRRDTPFMCTIRFKNDLPEIPGDPKLLVSRYEPEKLSSFFLTSIEQQPRRELLLPADAGVTISLMDLERYDVPIQQPGEPKRRLDPADEALLQDVDNLPSQGAAVSPLKVKRATRGANPSWLMATTYLTSTAGSAGRRGTASAGSSRFELAQQQQELTREQQLADIDATFTAAQQAPRHPTKRGVTAVSSMPIFPDFGTWEDKYVTVTFEEGDPASESKTLSQVKDPAMRAQLVSRCMIKSYAPQAGEKNDPAMGLLVPRAAAAAAAQGEPIADGCGVEELEGDYNWDCEYGFELATRTTTTSAPDMLLLVMHEDRVGYCQFDGQLKLRKRKRQEGDEPRPEKAAIYNRGYTEDEMKERRSRRSELEVTYEAGFEDDAAQQESEHEDAY